MLASQKSGFFHRQEQQPLRPYVIAVVLDYLVYLPLFPQPWHIAPAERALAMDSVIEAGVRPGVAKILVAPQGVARRQYDRIRVRASPFSFRSHASRST